MSGSSGEKTEEPTPKKLKDARDKGQVSNSKEVVSAFVVMAVAGYLFASLDSIIDNVKAMILTPPEFYTQPFDQALVNTVNILWDNFLDIVLPMVLCAAAAGIMGNYMQIGTLFSVDPIIPKMEKIDPIKGFKKIFAMKNVVEFFKSVVKVLVIAGTCVYVIRLNLNDILKIPVCREHCIMDVLGHLMFQMILFVMGAFILISAADVIYQKYQHKKGLKMTKDEIKQEYKNMEGSPEIKGRRRQIHKEIMNGEGMEKAVKKSSVVVTNPTHLAVGVHYASAEKKLPNVTIKGEMAVAKKIRDIADKVGVPVMENVYLARTLYSEANEWEFIPRHMMEPMAEVIRWVNNLRANQGEDPL